jgi:TolA-binding protein
LIKIRIRRCRREIIALHVLRTKGIAMPSARLFLVLLFALTTFGPAYAQTGGGESYDFAAALFDRGMHERSIPAWRKFLKSYPNDRRANKARFHLGESLFQTKEMKSALEEFESYLTAKKGDLRREAYFRRGDILAQLDRHADAIKSLSEVRKKSGDDVWVAATYISAESLLKLNRKKNARSLLSSILKAKNNEAYRANAELALGFLSFEEDDFSTAKSAFLNVAQGVALKEIAAEAKLMLGECELELGDFEQSDAAFREALNSGCSDFYSDAWIGRGRIRIRADQISDAGPCFKKSMANGGGEKAARVMIREAALLHEKGNTKGGLQVLAMVPGSMDVVAKDLAYWRGILASEGGDAEAGLKALETAVKGEATPNRRYRYADALMRSQRFDDAARQFELLDSEGVEKILRFESRFSRAFCLSQLKQHNAAAALLATLDKGPVPKGIRIDATFARAENLFLVGNYRSARSCYASVAKRADEDDLVSRSLYKTAWCSFRLEEFDQALQQFRQLAKRPINAELSAEARHLTARCLEKMGRTKEARQVHESLVSSPGEGSEHKTRSLLILAEEARESQQHDKAMKYYETLGNREVDAKTASAVIFGTAAVHASQGNEAEAVDTYSSFIKQFPEDGRTPEARIGLAWSLYRMGRLESARAVCETKLKEVRLDGERAFVAGLIERQAEKHEAAGRILDGLASSNPPHARSQEAMLLAGLSFAKCGQESKAARLLHEFTEQAKDSKDQPVALYELAFVLLKMKKDAGAETAFVRLIKNHPQSKYAGDAAFRMGERFYERKEFDTAFDAYAFCVKNSENPALVSKAQYKAGWSAMKAKRLDEAASRFVEAAKVGGSLACEALFQAASCRYELKEFDDSLALFQQLRKEHPRHELAAQAGQRILTNLGVLGRHSEVLKLASSTLSMTAEDAWSLSAWATVADSARNLKINGTAIRAYKHVAEKGARDDAARARYWAAECILADQGKEAAVDAFLKVSIFHEVASWSAKALSRAGETLESLGRPTEALKIWQDIVQRYPGEKQVSKAKQHIKALKSKEPKK